MWRTHQWRVHISQFYYQSRKYVKIVLIIRVGFKNFLLQTQAVIIHSLFGLYFKQHENIVKFNNSIFSKYSDLCVIARIFFLFLVNWFAITNFFLFDWWQNDRHKVDSRRSPDDRICLRPISDSSTLEKWDLNVWSRSS